MDFETAKNFLFSLIDYEKKKTYVESLEPFFNFLNQIGNPHKEIKNPILVVGTKGKGSTSHFISYGLQSMGFTVGLYTSPHLVDVRERIKVNGEKIPEERFAHYIELLKPLIEKKRGMRTVFETLTAMAFLYFIEENVDYCVLEAGLGGRLDATNVVEQILTVITPISLDHTHILGKKVHLIAGEKASVIKNESPTVIAPQHFSVRRVIEEKARFHNSRIFILGKDAIYRIKEISMEGLEITYRGINLKKHFFTRLTGTFQARNIALAALALEVLGFRDFDFKETRMEGRFEKIREKPLLIIDGAHNPLSIKNSLISMKKLAGKDFALIFGINSDKNVKKIMEIILKYNPVFIYATKASTRRAMEPQEIEKIFREAGYTRIKSYNTSSLALKEALKNEKKILVTGSFYLAGEVKSLSENTIASNT